LLNLTDGGEGLPDAALTPEAIAKAAAARKNSPKWWASITTANKKRIGIPLSEEQRANISAANTGRKFPPEFGAKISAAQKGRPAHPNSTEGARRAKLGSKESEETKNKKRLSMEKHREAQSERQRRNWEDPEYRARVIANMKARNNTSRDARAR